MVILPQGDHFAAGPSVSGSKPHGKCYKYCPYSTQITDYNQDARVSSGEKTYHGETEGQLYSYSISGVMGWVCLDNDCSYYTGTAITEVSQAGRKFVPASGTTSCSPDLPTLSGSVAHLTQGRRIVAGTRYLEI